MSSAKLREELTRLRLGDEQAAAAARERVADILRPAGALARLDDLAVWVSRWQGRARPAIQRPHTILFAADHGVAGEGVSAYPADVTAAMVAACDQGRATVNALAAVAGSGVEVVDVGVGNPTANLRVEPAMHQDRFDAAIARGMEAVSRAVGDGAADLLIFGEMGIGNTTAAAAVCGAVVGGRATDWVGRGTGLDDGGLAHKATVVQDALDRLPADLDPLRCLAEVGGAEMAAIAGATVAARQLGVPVLLDGFIVTSAVAPLHALQPAALDHCRSGHRSAEPGHRRLLDHLGLQPILDLDLRLGEGSGALAALPLVAMACAAVSEVATFTEWFGPQ